MVTQSAEHRPKRIELRPDGEWLRIDNVPLFDEHTGDDGVLYDKSLLEQIAENNNFRIRDTGDFCPVVILHTDDEAVNGDPPVIGMAGPFSVELYGKENPRYCIMGTFWVDPKEEGLFRKYPRRSVELWGEEDPTERFFDPISLLGAETPKRDLGMLYRKSGVAKPVLYEMEGGVTASTPSATNTFIPGAKKKKNYVHDTGSLTRGPRTPSGKKVPGVIIHDKGDAMPLSPEELDQIKQVLIPMIESVVDERMSMDPNEGGEELLPPDPEMQLEEGGEIPGEGVPGEEDLAAELGQPELPPEGLNPDQQEYAKHHYNNLMGYMGDDGQHDEDGMRGYMSGMSDDDRQLMDRYMMEQPERNAAGAVIPALGAALKAAGPSIAAGAGQVAGAKLADRVIPDKKKENCMRDAYQKYRKEPDMSSSTERSEKIIARRNQDLVQLNRKLTDQNERLQKDKIELNNQVKRYRRAADVVEAVSEGVIIEDRAAEVEDNLYMNDEQWTKHLYRMKTNYTRVPLDTGETFTDGKAEAKDRQNSEESEKEIQYSRRARDLVVTYRKKGKRLGYPEVLKHVKEHNGEFDISEFEAVA